jgi:outer membrane immunogenic protein
MKIRLFSPLTLGLITATSLSATVMAADVVPEYVPFDWTGPYIGAHVGWGWIDLEGKFDSDNGDNQDFQDDGGGDFDLDDNNILGGLQIGYNVQLDQFVLGIEGDVSFTDLNDDQHNGDGEKVSFDTNTIISLRARAGLAIENVLLYATAGGAWTDTNYEAEDDPDDTNTSGDVDLDDIGLVVGGGAEFAFDENWSVRAEGLYYWFDEEEDTSDLTGDSDGDDFIRLNDIFVIRAGINFRF